MAQRHDAVAGLGRPRVLVLGDIMLDRYTWGSAERISPEAPVMVIQAQGCDLRLGGAGAVGALLCGMEADVVLAGAVGEDGEGRAVRRLLHELAIDTRAVVTDPQRSTTLKERFLARVEQRPAQQVLRVDREDRHPLPAELVEAIVAGVAQVLSNVSAVLISDYGKGTCTPQLLAQVVERARGCDLPVLVDPARGADYSLYRGATVIKPNRREAEMAAGMRIATVDDAWAAGRKLVRRHGFQAAAVTLDGEGMVLVTAEGHEEHVTTRTRAVCDITGAGDMVLAALGLCQAGGWSLIRSVRLANAAAGLEVERPGVVPVGREQIAAALHECGCGSEQQHRVQAAEKRVSVEQMTALAAAYRREGKRVVFTNGCFDLLHAGHVSYLQQAASLGDVLVVAVNSDASVRGLKGPGRPIVAQGQRAALLAALACVDHVLIFDEDTPERLLEQLRPDVLVKGGTTAEVVGSQIVAAYGGTVRILDAVADVSTTRIVSLIRRQGGYAPPEAGGSNK